MHLVSYIFLPVNRLRNLNIKHTPLVNLTLVYINSGAVIPVPAFAGINSSGNPAYDTGFRVKPGMTNKAKIFLNHYTLVRYFLPLKLFLCFPIKINTFFRQNTGITVFFHNLIPDR